ncbi:unnamed protein product [Orchesella dallaii]|uniref:Arrestin C-terminal-like domain-containing protein n=1 Tax=Orchesella dallaii TaxID=48710 RepID=A0ABP1QTL7_9HEXA
MFSVGASCPVNSHKRMSIASGAWLGSSNTSGIRQFRFPNSSHLGKGTIRRNYTWKAKAEYFGIDLKTNLEVDCDTVKPFSKITGHLIIDTKFPIEHDGIVVQLEALCSLNYSTKHNERTSTHKGKGCILENTKMNPFGHLESPIRCEIIAVTPPEFGGHSINSGVWHYPFTLTIPNDPLLPAPFENSHGHLDYRLVVYMVAHSSSTFVKLAEKPMSCEGHYNLYNKEEAIKPIVIEQYYRKSYFSQKKLVKAILSMQNTGYLQEEDIPFSLFIKNPKCIPLHLTVSLIQQIKYQASTNLASMVKTVTTVQNEEKDESDEPQTEILWAGILRVPENNPPTYSCNSMYSVNYVLQFEVRSLGEVIISGEASILLGTTRDPIRELNDVQETPPPGELYRSESESSIHSQRSIYSTPIAYSVPANLNLSTEEDEEGDVGDDEADDEREHIAEASDEPVTPTPSENSLQSAQSCLTMPPSYSQLSSRIPSTETRKTESIGKLY